MPFAFCLLPFAFLPFCSFVGDPQSLLAGFLVGWVRYFRSRRASWVVLGLFWLALPIEVSLSFFGPARTCGGPRCTWHQTLFWRTNLTCKMVSAGTAVENFSPKLSRLENHVSNVECHFLVYGHIHGNAPYLVRTAKLSPCKSS